MARSRSVAIGVVAAVVLAGGVAWLLDRNPGPDAPPAPGADPAAAEGPTSVAESPAAIAPEAPLRGPGVLTGRLVRGSAASPVPGEITLRFPGRPPVVAAAGVHGAFRVEGLPVETAFDFAAASPGLQPCRFPGVEIPRVGYLDVGDIQLGTGATVEVLVTRGAMEPAAGAAVILERPRARDLWSEGPYDLLLSEPLPGTAEGRIADPEGKVAFPGTSPGPWIVRASAADCGAVWGHIEVEEGVRPSPLRLHLALSHALTGTVRMSGGAPAPGVEVTVQSARSTMWSAFRGVGAVTDREGRYRLDGIGEGEFHVILRPTPRTMRTVGTVWVPEVAVFDVTLDPGITLCGTVVEDDGGAPVVGARVTAFLFVPGPVMRPAAARAESGPDGKFELAGLPPGSQATIHVRKEGRVPATVGDLDAFSRAISGDVLEREVRLTAGGSVRGTVRDSGGRPLAGALVGFAPADDGDGAPYPWDFRGLATRTGEDGTFLLAPCLAGKGTLSVHLPGFVDAGSPGEKVPETEDGFRWGPPPSSARSVAVVAGRGTTQEFVLAAGAIVAGVVQDAAGAPVAGIPVRATGGDLGEAEVAGPASDAEGRFRIEGVPAGQGVVVRARKASLRGESPPFDVPPSGTAAPVAVTVHPAAAVSGKVRGAGEEPLVDPRLLLVRGNLDDDDDSRRMSSMMGGESALPERDGAFRFEGVDAGEYGILAYARGRSPVVVRGVRVEKGMDVEGIEIVLPPGLRLAGKVVDDGGAPVQGAAISLGGNPPCLMEDHVVLRVTGPDGRFALEDLVEGNLEVIARCAGRPEVRKVAPAGATDLMLVLEPGLRIAGVVVDGGSGRPIPGALVTVMDAAAGSPDPSPFEEDRSVRARTDAQGRFSAGPLAAGSYGVHAEADAAPAGSPGTFTPLRLQGVKAGTEDLRLVLAEGLRIAGRIEDGEGRPVREPIGISVDPLDGDGDRVYGRTVEGTSREDGTFEVPGLPPGRYEVEFQPARSLGFRGMAPGSSLPSITLPSVEAGTGDLVVRMSSGLAIAGKVLDESGNPPEELGILQVTSPGGKEAGAFDFEMVMVGTDGTFTTPPLPLGWTYDLKLERLDGFAPTAVTGIAPGAADVVLRVSRGRGIAGRLLLPDGRPAPAGIPVEAEPVDDGSSAETESGPDGSFRITGLEEGEYRVVAGGQGSDHAPSAAAGNIRAGAIDVEILLEPGFTVSGVLVDAEGRPQRSVALRGYQKGKPANFVRTETAADGTFRLKGLARGKVDLDIPRSGEDVELGTFDAPSTGLRLVVKGE